MKNQSLQTEIEKDKDDKENGEESIKKCSNEIPEDSKLMIS